MEQNQLRALDPEETRQSEIPKGMESKDLPQVSITIAMEKPPSADNNELHNLSEYAVDSTDTPEWSNAVSERGRLASEEAEETFSEAEFTESDVMESETDMPSLRPLIVPQAPRNFTQFIMDEHDDCDLFIDFNKGNQIKQGESYPVSNSVRDQEYFDQDFQNVYQSTRETEVLELPRETLIERILEMRERVKVLHDQLAEREENDPQNILTKLHAALLELQEENKKLRNRLGPCKLHRRATSVARSISSGSSVEKVEEE